MKSRMVCVVFGLLGCVAICVVLVPAVAVGAVGVPVKAGLSSPAYPARGNVTFALPEPSSGEIVIEPLALFSLRAMIVFLCYNTSPLA